jgi:hypothetical protein
MFEPFFYFGRLLFATFNVTLLSGSVQQFLEASKARSSSGVIVQTASGGHLIALINTSSTVVADNGEQAKEKTV